MASNVSISSRQKVLAGLGITAITAGVVILIARSRKKDKKSKQPSKSVKKKSS